MTDYYTNKPAGSSDPKQGDDAIRDLAKANQEINNVDHKWSQTDSKVDDTDKGKHRKVEFVVDQTITDLANGTLAKDSNGELYFVDGSGNQIQLTRDGYLNLDKNILANNTSLQADNAAGDGTVNIIEVTSGDEVNIPTKATLADGSELAAATEDGDSDRAIADKKYVDEKAAIPDDDAFGSWVSKSEYTVYQAATDGFVVGWTGGLDDGQNAYVYSDSSTSPTTIRQHYHSAGSITGGNKFPICCPIKKGDYWKYTDNASDGSCILYWLPIGG
jgi:hypothetical protein